MYPVRILSRLLALQKSRSFVTRSMTQQKPYLPASRFVLLSGSASTAWLDQNRSLTNVHVHVVVKDHVCTHVRGPATDRRVWERVLTSRAAPALAGSLSCGRPSRKEGGVPRVARLQHIVYSLTPGLPTVLTVYI